MPAAENETCYGSWVSYTRAPPLSGRPSARTAAFAAFLSRSYRLMLADAGYDTGRIMEPSAVVRVLAYWHYHCLDRDGPAATIARLCDRIGQPRPGPSPFRRCTH
jgi:hypothetical protein